MAEKKIIDFHCHIHKGEWELRDEESEKDWALSHARVYRENKCDEEAILANMAEAGISQTVLFARPSAYVDLNKANTEVLALGKKYPNQLIPFAIFSDNLEEFINHGARGVKIHTWSLRKVSDRTPAGNEVFWRGVEKFLPLINEKKLPIVLHAGPDRAERVINISKSYKDLTIVVAHLGADFLPQNQFKPEINQVLETLEKVKGLDNVFFDVSVIFDPLIIQSAIQKLGSDRLLFGSDFPASVPTKLINILKEMKLSDGDLENIFYKNAARILNLK